jgi:SAM-dependent methyltransferase
MLLNPSSFTDAAEHIAVKLGNLDIACVQAVFGSALRYRLHDPTLRGEFSGIVDRYVGASRKEMHSEPTQGAPVQLIAEYFSPSFVAGTSEYRSFRIRNNTSDTFHSTGDKPYNLSYWLTNKDGQRFEGVRSMFPVPLRAGHELTIPTLIKAPDIAGDYDLEIQLVQEHVGWFSYCPIFAASMEVVETATPRTTLRKTIHSGYFDFAKDLEYCRYIIDLAYEQIKQQGQRDVRVLEVACGNDPQILRAFKPNMQVIACDLAFPQVQLGSLQYMKHSSLSLDSYVFASCDVFNLPFQAAAFDIVVVTAALHHFANTVDALISLKALLKRTGKIVLLREPGKVCPSAEAYVMELANGFNEQQFELAEYDVMFARAGLGLDYEQMDFECSYKAILRPIECL